MVKRLFDIVFSLTALLFLGWILVVTYIIAAVDTQNNGFFFQKRIGRFGKPFTIVKIRTMRFDATGAASISRLGAFFRRSKMDELPQLLNVLYGTMSVVGPRPDISGYYDVLEGSDRRVLQLKPGLTGPASLKYFNEEALLRSVANPKEYNDTVLFPDKVKINLEYLDHWSFWLDLKVIFRTVFR